MQRAFRVGNVDWWYSKVKRLGRAPLVLHVFVRRFGLIVKAYLIFGVIKKRLCVYDPSSFVQQRSTWLLVGQENGFLNGQVKRRKDEPSPSEGWFWSAWFLAWWSHQGRFDIIWDCRDPRWRHQLETFSALLALCEGNSPGTGEFPLQRPVTRNFEVFFDLRLNKRLNKHSRRWWFEMPSRPLWRHR